MGYNQPIQPLLSIIAIVLVGLFTANWYQNVMHELKEIRKALSEIERRLDVVRRRPREEEDQRDGVRAKSA